MLEIPEILMLPRTGQTVSYRTGDDGDIRAGWAHAPRFVVSGNLVVDNHTGLMWVREIPKIIPGGNAVAVPFARGVWSPASAYAVGDLVQGDGSPDALYYVCTQAHTNHEPPNASYWMATPWTSSAANLTTPATMVFTAAIDACNALVYAGFTDWRLPNLMELCSLFNCDSTSTAVYPEFANWPSGVHGSSSCHAANTTQWCIVYFGYPNTSTGPRTTAYIARPVRSL